MILLRRLRLALQRVRFHREIKWTREARRKALNRAYNDSLRAGDLLCAENCRQLLREVR